jgi:hypothetical protein
MELLVKLWQRLHYYVFEFNKFTQLNIFGLPVLLFLKNGFVKKIYNKRGVANPDKIVKNALVDKKNSTIIWLSDVFMCILLILVLFSILNIASALSNKILLGSLNKAYFLIVCLVPSIGLNYYLLWKNDKYLTYFIEFDKEPKAVKRKWAWISFGVVVGIILLLIASFWIMTEVID